MSIITIARQFGAGGKTLGTLVADRLGYTLVDEEIVELIAKEANISPEWVDSVARETGSEKFIKRLLFKLGPFRKGYVDRALETDTEYFDGNLYISLLHKILPQIANKAAETLGKPPVAIDEIITQIMDILWIEDEVTYEKKEESWITKSKITLTNYMTKKQQFTLYAIKPHEAVLHTVTPHPTLITDTYLKWHIKNLSSNAKQEICFELTGIDKGDFDDNDLYIQGVNPVHVIGAEKWEGD